MFQRAGKSPGEAQDKARDAVVHAGKAAELQLRAYPLLLVSGDARQGFRFPDPGIQERVGQLEEELREALAGLPAADPKAVASVTEAAQRLLSALRDVGYLSESAFTALAV